MNERTIWDKLVSAGMSGAGAAGLMGNLYAESALNPQNLQNSYEKKLGYSDTSYTQAVDSGKYTRFIHDQAGYGLAQWTYWTRKQALLSYAKKTNKSIGDLDMQLNFLIYELKSGYAGVWRTLCSASSVKNASDAVMCQYERPADVSSAAKSRRAAFGQKYYDMFALTESVRTHTVVSGDTLTKLAGKYHTTIQTILNNNLDRYPDMTADLIRVGWILKV